MLPSTHNADAGIFFSRFSSPFSPKNNNVWNVVPTHWTFSEHPGHMLAFHSMFLRHCAITPTWPTLCVPTPIAEEDLDLSDCCVCF